MQTAPIRPLMRTSTLHSQMNRMFNDFFRAAPGASWTSPATAGVFPLINAWRTEEGFVIESELPGYRLEDLDITLTGDELTIAGNPQGDERAEGGQIPMRRERRRRAFSRTIQLPEEVDAERVSARLTNGVLTIALPHVPARQPRRIAVQGE